MKNEVLKTLLVCLVLVVAILLTSCSTIPKGLSPVQHFNTEKYLGKWYEIARYDFMFEKNMSNVTAIYSMNSNGTIRVENNGFDMKKQEWKQKIGKAKYFDAKDVGALKVSFFGPFYSSYTIIALDPDYNYALVAGANKKLLWILSRTPTIPNNVKMHYLEIAEDADYDTKGLVWTIQDKNI